MEHFIHLILFKQFVLGCHPGIFHIKHGQLAGNGIGTISLNRRGTDILKALALGADAIMIGRPYLWGLGSFGQPGVERALEILRDEFKIAMEFACAPSINDIGPDSIGRV